MKVIAKIEVDLFTPLCVPSIDVVQEDTVRVLEVTLLYDGVAWSPPSGTVVSVAYRREDGSFGRYDKLSTGDKACSISGNVVTAALDPEVVRIAGQVKLSLIVQDSTTLDQIATFPVNVNVTGNPAAASGVSNNYYNYTTLEAIDAGITSAKARASNVGHYISFDDVILELNTTTNEITLHAGFICMRTWRKQIAEAVTVTRDTTSGLSYLVYDVTDATVKSIPGSSFSDTQVLIAIISKTKPSSANANYITGVWSVDGVLAPTPVGFEKLQTLTSDVSIAKSRASNVGHFVCFNDTTLSINTTTNKINLSGGFIYTYGGRHQVAATEVTRDTTSAISLLVYDITNKVVKSIHPDSLLSSYSVIAVLSRDHPTSENANYIPGLWSVDGVTYPKVINIDDKLSVSGEAADAAVVGEKLQSLRSYMYGAEKVVHFITSSDTVLNINTAAGTITVNKGFVFYKNSMMETTQTTVSILDTTSVNVIVYDTSATTKIRNIRIADFDGSKMYLLAILWKGQFDNYSANVVPGLWSVDGVVVSSTPTIAETKKTVWVSTSGSDSNTGENGSPFKTINKAIASGATTIFVYAGTYKEAINVSNSGGELEILAKPMSYTNKDVIIDLGKELTFTEDSATGLVKAILINTEETFMKRAFVSKTEQLIYDDSFITNGYACNLWYGDTKLIPVLTVEECKATAGTWTYDGSYVYANGAAGAYTLNDGESQYGIYLAYLGKVKLTGITVKHAREDAVRLKGCTDSEISRCMFAYSGLYTGLALENSSGVVRNCEAKFVRTDGFNIHGVSTADFIDCVSHDNGDDGISHHEESGGIVIGGEYYNNVKGGVCSPTFGSRNSINGVYIHDNGYGVNGVTSDDGREYPPCTVSNCAIVNNNIGIRADRYTLHCWNNILSGNGSDIVEANGGKVNTIN